MKWNIPFHGSCIIYFKPVIITKSESLCAVKGKQNPVSYLWRLLSKLLTLILHTYLMLIWNLLGSCLDSLCEFSCRCALQSSRPPAPSEIWRSVLQCSRCASPAKTEVVFWERKVLALASRGSRWTLIWDSTSVRRGLEPCALRYVCRRTQISVCFSLFY